MAKSLRAHRAEHYYLIVITCPSAEPPHAGFTISPQNRQGLDLYGNYHSALESYVIKCCTTVKLLRAFVALAGINWGRLTM